MNGRRQLVTTNEAVQAKGQHKTPCSDCPWARKSLPGWLGGSPADDWLKEAHGDFPIPCHVFEGAECAGAAIYRRNVLKTPRQECLRLEANRELVFATPSEFKQHHERPVGERFPGLNKAEGTQGTPPGVSEMANGTNGNATKTTGTSTNGKANPVAELKAKNAAAVTTLKDRHTKTVATLKAGHDKKLAALAAKSKKETDKVVNDLSAVDDMLLKIGEALNGKDVAKAIKAAKGLVEKARKVCDKHLT